MHTKINVNLKKIKNNILYLYTVNYKAYSRVKRKRAYFISLFDMYFFFILYILYSSGRPSVLVLQSLLPRFFFQVQAGTITASFCLVFPPPPCKFNYSWLGIAYKQLPISSLLCATWYQYLTFHLLVSDLSTVLNPASDGQLYLPLTWLAFDTSQCIWILSLVRNRVNAIGVPELADGWLLNIKEFLQVLGSI